MSGRYETMNEVFQELRRRKFDVEEQRTRQKIETTCPNLPIDDLDLNELIDALHLNPSDEPQDKYIAELNSTLESDEWQTALIAARHKIGLPYDGISKEKAQALHIALLETIAGVPKTVTLGTMTKPVLEVWTDIVREGRLLCRIIKIDPSSADSAYTSFAAGSADWLIGIGKLLNPGWALKIGGREIVYQSSAFDRLIGHLLWGLPLSPSDTVDRPGVGLRWERLPDGAGRFIETRFTPGRTTAAEDRALKQKFAEMKEMALTSALLMIETQEGPWLNMDWKERWKLWMKVFPDFYYPSPDALRKAVARALKKHPKICRLGPSSQSARKHQAVSEPNEIPIVDMKQTEAVNLLRLFNNKANKLEGLNFTKSVASSGVTISGKQGGNLTAQRQGPDDASIGAFALAMRFFMPDNETALSNKMAGLYAEIPASQDLVDKINDARIKVNNELNKPSPIKFNDAFLTYRAICEEFLWGKLPLVDQDKKALHDACTRTPVFEALLQNEFVYVLGMLSAMIFFMRDLNKTALGRLQSKT